MNREFNLFVLRRDGESVGTFVSTPAAAAYLAQQYPQLSVASDIKSWGYLLQAYYCEGSVAMVRLNEGVPCTPDLIASLQELLEAR